MLFFLGKGFRVIAHDRRGHGRSSQTGSGHDMDHYADDLAALTAHLDLKDAVHVGHLHRRRRGCSLHRAPRREPGGEGGHYFCRAAADGKDGRQPGRLPKEVFDGIQAQLAASRTQFYYDLPAGPFYGFNRPGAKVSQAVIWNWWRQGMMGGAKAHYDGVVAFSQTDFTEDLKKITVPVLVMHGDDDQIVPYADSAPLSGKAAAKRRLGRPIKVFRTACPPPKRRPSTLTSSSSSRAEKSSNGRRNGVIPEFPKIAAHSDQGGRRTGTAASSPGIPAGVR